MANLEDVAVLQGQSWIVRKSTPNTGWIAMAPAGYAQNWLGRRFLSCWLRGLARYRFYWLCWLLQGTIVWQSGLRFLTSDKGQEALSVFLNGLAQRISQLVGR